MKTLNEFTYQITKKGVLQHRWAVKEYYYIPKSI